MKQLSAYLLENTKDPARIFVIVKPGFYKYIHEILERFEKDDWKLEKITTKQLLLKEAKRLYAIHKDEEWYKDLCEYMSSEPTTAMILKNENMVMSPEIFDKVGVIKDELRKKYGEDEMRNVIHSSDSIAHMNNEKSVYFAV